MKDVGTKVADIRSLLEQRSDKLKKIIRKTEIELSKAPTGKIHIINNHGRTQFYERSLPNQKNGQYIRKKEKKRIADLVNKKYMEDTHNAASRELDLIENFLAEYPNEEIHDWYPGYPEEARKYLKLIEPSDQDLVRMWMEEKYTSNPLPVPSADYTTDLGEWVRSKSELNIANTLHKYNIPYKYEYPVKLKRQNNSPHGGTYTETVYPDFCALNVRTRKVIYWEHLGMLDDREYREKNLAKIIDYEANGIFPGDQLVITHETMKNPLSTRQIKMVIEHYLL